MLPRQSSPLAPMLGFALLASVVGCEAPSATAINVELVAAPSQLTGTEPLLVRTMTAKIDGVWHDLAKTQAQLELPLGHAPEARGIMKIAPPGGHMTALRIEVADARPGRKGHIIEAACNESLPSCPAGRMLLQIEQPRGLVRGEGRPVLRLMSLNTVTGVCGDLVVEPNVDIGVLPPADMAQEPSCGNVVCPPGQECRGGQCFVTDPCMNVVCPPGQVCAVGQCVMPVDMSPVPDMTMPRPDMSTPPSPDMSKPSCDPHHDCSHTSCSK